MLKNLAIVGLLATSAVALTAHDAQAQYQFGDVTKFVFKTVKKGVEKIVNKAILEYTTLVSDPINEAWNDMGVKKNAVDETAKMMTQRFSMVEKRMKAIKADAEKKMTTWNDANRLFDAHQKSYLEAVDYHNAVDDILVGMHDAKEEFTIKSNAVLDYLDKQKKAKKINSDKVEAKLEKMAGEMANFVQKFIVLNERAKAMISSLNEYIDTFEVESKKALKDNALRDAANDLMQKSLRVARGEAKYAKLAALSQLQSMIDEMKVDNYKFK